MGGGRWNADDYKAYTTRTAGFDADKRFATSAKLGRVSSHGTRGLSDLLDPKGIKVRESRDSVDNPNSTPVIVALDVTGSMGTIANHIAEKGLGTLFTEILERKPVTDPHLMFMGVGDPRFDSAPLQVSQFEADKRIIDQLTDLYIEHGGGGNFTEGYNLPWYFAALKTSIDSIEKRNKKGYLFTVGDEEAPGDLELAHIQRVFGDTPERAYSNEELLTMVGRMYHVFHVIVEEGQHFVGAGRGQQARDSWSAILGQRALPLKDHTKLSEVIVSAIEVTEGREVDVVAKSWAGDTSVVVADALRALAPAGKATGTGPVRF